MLHHANPCARVPTRSAPVLAPFPALLLALALTIHGCGGGSSASSSFGVSNGTITGAVYGIVGGVPGTVPLAGVTVTATRIDASPALIRTAVSDAYGTYVLGDVPLGTWELSFRANGFASTSSGALGERLRVYVESGSLAIAPDFVMIETGASGSGNVILYLVDQASGQPIVGATVSLGGFSASSTGFDGSYFFNVPVSRDPFTGLVQPMAIFVYHPAFSNAAPFPSQVIPVVGSTISQTVALAPSGALVTGQLQASTLHSLYSSAGAFGSVSISSPQVSPSFLSPSIDPSTGFFTVQVPPSTSTGSFFLSLTFSSPLFQDLVIPGILAPGPSGVASLSSPVVLQPRTTTLVGNVINSQGIGPTGFPSQVVVVQTGQAANLVNGAYQVPGVPTGLLFDVRATASGPFGIEQGQTTVFPLAGPSFNVPTIVTGS